MTAQLPISTDAQRIGITARDFWTLADAGAFTAFAKTELIEGGNLGRERCLGVARANHGVDHRGADHRLA